MNFTKVTIKNAATRKDGHMKRIFFSALFLLGSVLPAQALQIGDLLRVEALFPDSGTVWFSQDFAVNDGVEVTINGATISVDVNASTNTPQILFDFNSEASFFNPDWASYNGFRFTDYTGTLGDFLDVSINGITNMTGFDALRVSYSADTIGLNFQGLSFDADTFVGLDVTQANAVPEPGTLVLLGAGLLGLGVLRRRRQTGLA